MTPAELRELVEQATPGPWATGYWMKDYGTYGGKWIDDAHTISAEKGKTLVCGNYDWEEGGVVNEADARLIALAPDLARLCAEMGEALTGYHPWFGPPHEPGCNACAALAKLWELK